MVALIEPKVQAEIKIDYAAKDADVFATFVKALLESDYTNVRFLLCDAHKFSAHHSPIEDLPSWCPDLRTIGPDGDVRLEGMSNAVKSRYTHYARYVRVPDYATIGLRVLRADRVMRCMSKPCPANTDLSDDATKRDVRAWLSERRQRFVTEHDDCAMMRLAWHRKWLEAETQASPPVMADLMRDRLDFCDPPPATAILHQRRNQYLLETMSGRLGYCTQAPVEGALIVLVPGLNDFQLLTPDLTRYIGRAAISGLMGNALLDLPPELEDKWEVVYLE